MSLLDSMQLFLTKPAELLMEVIYAIGLQICKNTGGAVIFLSLCMTVPALFLFHWADSIHVSDENRKNGTARSFSLWDVLGFFFDKVSFSLLLELLLFASAYFFFTGSNRIWGGSFIFIRNLGKPDALINFGRIRLNLLPICTLVLRTVSNMIRLKGAGRWIRIRKLAASLLFFGISYSLLSGFTLYRLVSELIVLMTVLFSVKKDLRRPVSIGIPGSSAVSRADDHLFSVNALYLTVLTGVLIPSTVISSAPTDFINVADYYSPLWYVFSTVLMAAGTFIIWGGFIYMIAPVSVKRGIAFILTVISVWGTVNSMFFGNDRGVMSDQLEYDIIPADEPKIVLINLGILILIALLLFMIWKKKTALLSFLVLVFCISKSVSSVVNITDIVKILTVEKENLTEQLDDRPQIPLSKKGKNVVFFMLDRSIGYFIPFMMAERPELTEMYDGFTFYPNTISFGTHTNEAAPALFGGYEYTPAEINARSDVLLADKHDEALRLLPVLFDEADYEVTVIDPPYAGYLTLSDLDIFSDHPDIHAFRASGRFSSPYKKHDFALQKLRRNFFCFSIYRIAPLFLQPLLYGEGSYNQMNLNQALNDLLSSQGIQDSFEQEYSVLQNLPAITKIIDEEKNTYLSIDNKTAHEAALLQLPDYTPAETVNNYGWESLPITRTSADGRTIDLDSTVKVTHYHADMASFLLIGEWLNYLRENDVYDNTRIIIAADHGFQLGFPDLEFDSELSEEVLTYNPVLMVKDFDAKGFDTDDQFMTNAEVPLIALEGLVSDPVNPATGNPLSNDAAAAPDLLIMHSEEWDIRSNNGTTFLPGRWFRFTGDDIFDPENWEFADIH